MAKREALITNVQLSSTIQTPASTASRYLIVRRHDPSALTDVRTWVTVHKHTRTYIEIDWETQADTDTNRYYQHQCHSKRRQHTLIGKLINLGPAKHLESLSDVVFMFLVQTCRHQKNLVVEVLRFRHRQTLHQHTEPPVLFTILTSLTKDLANHVRAKSWDHRSMKTSDNPYSGQGDLFLAANRDALDN